jgi:hypothetical protein
MLKGADAVQPISMVSACLGDNVLSRVDPLMLSRD